MDPIRRQRRDMCVIGFALFSMFFGAGNVIFPPYLGLGCGREWALGFLCYYLADVGLALMAIFAIVRSGSSQKRSYRVRSVSAAGPPISTSPGIKNTSAATMARRAARTGKRIRGVCMNSGMMLPPFPAS